VAARDERDHEAPDQRLGADDDAAGVAEFIKLGANLVTISAWGLLRLGAEDFRKRVDAALQV
jgi:hypothetical protein